MSDQNRKKGFTLIELIMTLLLMGIIFVVVLSRGMSTAEVNLKAQTEVLKSHIRYAQLRAMNMTSTTPSTCKAPFGMVMSGVSYSMFRDCVTTNKVGLPGAESSVGVALPSGMTVTSTTFSFDSWGRPHAGENPDPLTQPSLNISLSLVYQGLTEPITITGNTGFVP